MNEEDASMATNESDVDDRTYKVVINDEEQYSIWFADRDERKWNSG